MSAANTNERILILDFGSQTTQLIARRVRELGVYCEIHPFDGAAETVVGFAPKGVILSGGPASAHVSTGPRIPQAIFDLSCPVLGICYGMQALAVQLGGEVIASTEGEFGQAQLTVTAPNALFADCDGDSLQVWMSHGDRVAALPPGFKDIAVSDNSPIAAMADAQRKRYGIQFHPEVSHTPQGKQLLHNFVITVCGCEANWLPEQIITQTVAQLQRDIGSEHVLLGLSGGVDSAVAAALLHRAIGAQLICVFVDTGLLRQNEQQDVQAVFTDHFGLQLITVDAREQFFSALQGVSDPEQKRKIIGKCFIDAFEAQARQFTEVKWLAQGTIYSDVIESAGGAGKAALIKSHHNVGGLPARLALKLVEPLKELFKDEVRQLGLELGLPAHLINRHPFPGPGLGVRVLGEVHAEYVQSLRKADAIFIEELHRFGWYHKVSQAFAVFLPVRSVGVMGDARRYEFVVCLRSVTTDDFMTAQWVALPPELLAVVSNRIINEVEGISRVTYDISNKPPATIEWE
jgi:GMP synthase (glutamine-hydrolysing)